MTWVVVAESCWLQRCACLCDLQQMQTHIRVAFLLHRISFQERRFSTAVNSRTRLSLSAPEAGDLQYFAAPGLRLWDRKTFQLELCEREKKKTLSHFAGILALETHKSPSFQVSFVKLVRFSFDSSPRPQPPPRLVINYITDPSQQRCWASKMFAARSGPS